MPLVDALESWTRTLEDELDALYLTDLERDPTIYRVFLMPDALQFDLSMTPAARFRLSADALARFAESHVGAVEPDALRPALAASVHELMREGAEAQLPHADSVSDRLAELR